MKKIRNNIFETNSSSSHSISIYDRNKMKADKLEFEPLVEDNILYPNRLTQYATYLEHGDGGHILKCDTVELKAALVANWIQHFIDEKEVNESYLDYISELLPYDKIVFKNTSKYKSSYYPYSEYGDSFSLSYVWEEDKETLNEWVEIILNDNIIIEDSEIPY